MLADDLAIDLDSSTDHLLVGVGGNTVDAVFVEVEVRLYRDHGGDDFVSWRTDIGFLEPWDAEFFVILGQIGFYDQFTVTMNRRVLTVLVQGVETPLTTDSAMASVAIPRMGGIQTDSPHDHVPRAADPDSRLHGHHQPPFSAPRLGVGSALRHLPAWWTKRADSVTAAGMFVVLAYGPRSGTGDREHADDDAGPAVAND